MAGVIASKVRKQRGAVKADKEEDQVGANYLNVGTQPSQFRCQATADAACMSQCLQMSSTENIFFQVGTFLSAIKNQIF